jgi:hypothetical protein
MRKGDRSQAWSCDGQEREFQISNAKIRNPTGVLAVAGKSGGRGDVLSSGKSSGNAWAAEQTAKNEAKIWAAGHQVRNS